MNVKNETPVGDLSDEGIVQAALDAHLAYMLSIAGASYVAADSEIMKHLRAALGDAVSELAPMGSRLNMSDAQAALAAKDADYAHGVALLNMRIKDLTAERDALAAQVKPGTQAAPTLLTDAKISEIVGNNDDTWGHLDGAGIAREVEAAVHAANKVPIDGTGKQAQLLKAGDSLARYFDEVVLILKETHPAKAQSLEARVLAWMAAANSALGSEGGAA